MHPTLLELSQALERAQTNPVEILEQALDKAPHAQDAWISLLPELAMQQAKASQARWQAGKPLSPLDGIPIAWKDVFDLAGTATTCASLSRSQAPAASSDAALVHQLHELGMVSVGKTNMSELAYSGLGINPYSGTPHNPFDSQQARIPGGSSSGSAAVVHAGVVACAMGSDTSGSIRIPAAYYGLAGYKPSSARYPRQGMFPLAPSLDTAGPIAHTMADIRLLDACLLGLDAHSSTSRLGFTPRFVVPDGRFLAQTAPAVQQVFQHALQSLKQAGYHVEHREFLPYTQTLDLFAEHGTLVAIESIEVHKELLDSPTLQRVDPRIVARLQRGRQIPPASAQLIRTQRQVYIQASLQALAPEEILIYPTVPVSPPLIAPLEHDPELFAQTNATVLSHTMPSSYLDMPTISLPAGLDSLGLPVGLSLSMRQNQDAALLEAAQHIEHIINVT